MADLNQGTRQRNLRQLSGSANVPNQLRNVGGGVPAPSTDLLQALGGHIGGWWIENQRLTADGGNAKLNANVPSISLGAATDYLTGAGIWFGKNSSVYKAHIGDPAANHLKWDGTTLTVVGTISATAGAIGGWTIGATSISADGGNVTIDSATPHLGIGANSYLGGAGVFLGKSSGAYKFSIGSLAGSYLSYDGGTGALTLNGTVTTNSLNPALQSFTTSIVFSSTDNDTVNWSAGTIRLASGMTYSINAGNTGNMAALTYIYLDTAVSTTALQTTTTYSNAVGDNRLLLAAAQNHAVGASVITHTGQQPIINAADQITALSITAAQIAADTITANKIHVDNLAAIKADLGSITAGTITGGTIRTAASGARVQMDGTYLAGYGTDGTTKQFYLSASDGKAYAGAGAVKLDNSGVSVEVDTTLIPTRAYRFVDGATLTGLLAGYADANSVVVDLSTQSVAGKSGFVYITAAAPSGETGNVVIQAMGLSDGAILTLAVSGTTSTAEIEADTTSITGTLTVSGLAVRPSGDARFSAWVNANILNVTGDGTGYGVVFTSEVYDDGNDFNTATGVFTAPVTGRYHFSTAVSLTGIVSGQSFAFVEIVTTAKLYRLQRVHAYNAYDAAALALVGSVDAAMTAGDTAYVRVYVFGGSKVVDVEGNATAGVTHFSGHLIA